MKQLVHLTGGLAIVESHDPAEDGNDTIVRVVDDLETLYDAITKGIVPDGEGDIEYLVCSGEDDRGSHVVEMSTQSSGDAVRDLVDRGPGAYVVAVRP